MLSKVDKLINSELYQDTLSDEEAKEAERILLGFFGLLNDIQQQQGEIEKVKTIYENNRNSS